MAVSDAILKRLLALHPKIIDLKLDRMERILAALGHPERKLPPVIHVAGTNGKGSVIAYSRAILEAAGLSVHVYTSPHLVRFHERIRIGAPGGGQLIAEADLIDLLEECETANGGEPITFFEITTAAALLAFSRNPADYLLLEVGLGGRLDATNVVDRPHLTAVTQIALDHQQYLGETIEEIAAEKAGIFKRDTPAIIGPQNSEAALGVLLDKAHSAGSPTLVGDQDWQAYEQHGRLVYQDETRLSDLPLPALTGRFQINNAGTAIAVIRALNDSRIGEDAVEQGIKSTTWPGRLQRLSQGKLADRLPPDSELWVDGGHNAAAGQALAESLADLNDKVARPLILIVGMLNTKTVEDYLRPFGGLAAHVITVRIPDEENALRAKTLLEMVWRAGLEGESAGSIEQAIDRAGAMSQNARVVIGGSLYLAGRVLAANTGTVSSGVSGASPSPRV